jgi:hypothetical protein
VLNDLLLTEKVFLSYAAAHVHTLNLTLPQFDVIMTFTILEPARVKRPGTPTLLNNIVDFYTGSCWFEHHVPLPFPIR